MPRYKAAIESLAKIVESLKRPENVERWYAPEVLAIPGFLELKRLANVDFRSRRSDPVPCDIPDDILTEACGELNLLFARLLTDRDRLAGLTEEAKMAGLLAPDVSLEDIIPCQPNFGSLPPSPN